MFLSTAGGVGLLALTLGSMVWMLEAHRSETVIAFLQAPKLRPVCEYFSGEYGPRGTGRVQRYRNVFAHPSHSIFAERREALDSAE